LTEDEAASCFSPNSRQTWKNFEDKLKEKNI